MGHGQRLIFTILSPASKPSSPNVGRRLVVILWLSWSSPPIGCGPPKVSPVSGNPEGRGLFDTALGICSWILSCQLSSMWSLRSTLCTLLPVPAVISCIPETFNNYVITDVSHIHKIATYMDMEKICHFPPYIHFLPCW